MHWVGEGVQPTSKIMMMLMMVMLAEERLTMMKRGHWTKTWKATPFPNWRFPRFEDCGISHATGRRASSQKIWTQLQIQNISKNWNLWQREFSPSERKEKEVESLWLSSWGSKRLSVRETCDLWDIWPRWWGDMTWTTKRQRQIQWQRQLENTLKKQWH